MFSSHQPHPILSQVPLTLSPFTKIPTPTTLPYTYRTLPATLPPSVLDAHNSKYITSSSGHSAHPNDILASTAQLRQHISSTSQDAKSRIEKWEQQIKERELAERRRVAPGWLDREEKILVPVRKAEDLLGERDEPGVEEISAMTPRNEGEELDRAFGGMGLK